jgi:hypothetical protein
MQNQDFTTTILVDKSPAEVYHTVLNFRAWWSGLYGESFEGKAEKIGDEFSFLAGEGAHYSKQKLTELVPNKKVVWLVTDAHLNFVGTPDEWKGTKIRFDISEEGNKTKVVFTHLGLVPDFECYDSCAPAWKKYLHERLTAALGSNFTTGIIVDASPVEVFNAVNNVRGWWSESVEGDTDSLDEEFLYYYKDVHISKMKIIEFVPNERVVWLVLENYFNFTTDKSEWSGTRIIFDITENEDKTELKFTHEGLVPAYECYDVCRDAWTSYIQGSLRDLITTGTGKPNAREGGLNAELIEKWKLPVK